MRILVFLIAYNEARTIGAVLDELVDVVTDLEHHVDILVVDDGSEDGTREEVIARGIKTISHVKNLGPGAASQTGYKYAVRNGYDATLIMDADGQHPPEEVPKLLEPLTRGEADIVIGSRFKVDTGYDGSLVRDVGIRFYSWMISAITGDRVYDLTSGFRAIRIDVARGYAKSFPAGIVAIERGMRDGLSEFRILEVPVSMPARKHGQSYLSVERLLKYPVYSVYSLLRALVRG